MTEWDEKLEYCIGLLLFLVAIIVFWKVSLIVGGILIAMWLIYYGLKKIRSSTVRVKWKLYQVKKGNLILSHINLKKLSEIHGLRRMNNVFTLDLSHNQLTEDVFFLLGIRISYVRNVDLSYNNVKKIPNIKWLDNLENLNLSHNQITQISSLKDFPALNIIDLSFNKISLFDGDVIPNTLTNENFQNNPITKIKNILILENCKNILLPEENIPPDILKKIQSFDGNNFFEKCRRYFQNQEQEFKKHQELLIKQQKDAEKKQLRLKQEQERLEQEQTIRSAYKKINLLMKEMLLELTDGDEINLQEAIRIILTEAHLTIEIPSSYLENQLREVGSKIPGFQYIRLKESIKCTRTMDQPIQNMIEELDKQFIEWTDVEVQKYMKKL